MPELMDGNVFDVDTGSGATRACIKMVILVKHHVRVHEVAGAVVPPVRLSDITARVVAKKHLVLVVQRNRRPVRRAGINQLNVGERLRGPRKRAGLEGGYGGGIRHVNIRGIDVVRNLICRPGEKSSSLLRQSLEYL